MATHRSELNWLLLPSFVFLNLLWICVVDNRCMQVWIAIFYFGRKQRRTTFIPCRYCCAQPWFRMGVLWHLCCIFDRVFRRQQVLRSHPRWFRLGVGGLRSNNNKPVAVRATCSYAEPLHWTMSAPHSPVGALLVHSFANLCQAGARSMHRRSQP